MPWWMWLVIPAVLRWAYAELMVWRWREAAADWRESANRWKESAARWRSLNDERKAFLRALLGQFFEGLPVEDRLGALPPVERLVNVVRPKGADNKPS